MYMATNYRDGVDEVEGERGNGKERGRGGEQKVGGGGGGGRLGEGERAREDGKRGKDCREREKGRTE